MRHAVDLDRELCGRAVEVQHIGTDRMLAAQLHQRGVPIETVENAFVLAAARRLIRPAGATPLGTIRSLAYFLPVIEEVLQLQVGQEYFQHLRHKLQRAVSAR